MRRFVMSAITKPTRSLAGLDIVFRLSPNGKLQREHFLNFRSSTVTDGNGRKALTSRIPDTRRRLEQSVSTTESG